MGESKRATIAAKASPGPWKDGRAIRGPVTRPIGTHGCTLVNMLTDDDAACLVAARNALPALLAVAEAARAVSWHGMVGPSAAGMELAVLGLFIAPELLERPQARLRLARALDAGFAVVEEHLADGGICAECGEPCGHTELDAVKVLPAVAAKYSDLTGANEPTRTDVRGAIAVFVLSAEVQERVARFTEAQRSAFQHDVAMLVEAVETEVE